MSQKVYKSSIVPQGSKFEGIQSNQMEISMFTIEVIHIVFFIGILLFIFKAVWKEAKLKVD